MVFCKEILLKLSMKNICSSSGRRSGKRKDRMKLSLLPKLMVFCKEILLKLSMKNVCSSSGRLSGKRKDRMKLSLPPKKLMVF
jgi:hypothetical protein